MISYRKNKNIYIVGYQYCIQYTLPILLNNTMDSNRAKVIDELKRNPDGFTISELAKKLKISRHTVANCLAFLEGAEKVKIRKVGMAKIYYWTGGED